MNYTFKPSLYLNKTIAIQGIFGEVRDQTPIKDPVDLAYMFLRHHCTSDGFQCSAWGSGTRDLPLVSSGFYEMFTSSVMLEVLNKSTINGRVMQNLRAFVSANVRGPQVGFFIENEALTKIFPPDVDCTSVGFLSLLKSKAQLSPTLVNQAANAILHNVIPEGNADAGVIQVYFPGVDGTRGSRENRVDAVVLANALRFLATAERLDVSLPSVEKSIQYLKKHLEDKISSTKYYPSRDQFLYFLALAIGESKGVLEPYFGALLRSELQGRIGAEPSVDLAIILDDENRSGRSEVALYLAMRVVACQVMDVPCDRDKANLIALQDPQDGGFPARIDGTRSLEAFFSCGRSPINFGSSAVSTAVALEALGFGKDVVLLGPVVKAVLDLDYPSELKVSEPVVSFAVSEDTGLLVFAEALHGKNASRYLALCANYTEMCSPEGATDEQKLVATQFLLIFYVLNDTLKTKTESQIKDLVGRFKNALQGRRNSKDETPFLGQVRLFGSTLRHSVGYQKNHFFEKIDNLFAGLREEASWSGLPGMESFQANRNITICVDAWIALWDELGIGSFESNPIRLHEQFHETESILDKLHESALHLIVTDNELGSVVSDLVNHKPSYVTIHMSEGYGLAQSLHMILQQRERHLNRFKEHLKSFEADVSVASPSLRHVSSFSSADGQGGVPEDVALEKSIAFIKRIVVGNLQATRTNPRYQIFDPSTYDNFLWSQPPGPARTIVEVAQSLKSSS